MKGLIKIKNTKDNECFRWCHLTHKFAVKKDPQWITKYQEHTSKPNYKGITFPVKIQNIPKVKKMNSIDISVYVWENEVFHALCSEQEQVERSAQFALKEEVPV